MVARLSASAVSPAQHQQHQQHQHQRQSLRELEGSGTANHRPAHRSLQLSQSLGAYCPGGKGKHLLLHRHLSDVRTISYAGYLLKRSNRPCRTPAAAATAPATKAAPLPFPPAAGRDGNDSHGPSIRLRPVPRHCDDPYPCDDYDCSRPSPFASAPPPPPLLPQRPTTPPPPPRSPSPEPLRAEESEQDERSLAFAASFFGVDLRSLDDPRARVRRGRSSDHENSLPSPSPAPACAPSPATERPTRRSSLPISIRRVPPQGSARAKAAPGEEAGGSSSSAAAAADHAFHDAELPPDYHAPDGHVWRAKYCLLEGGVLYFYRYRGDAESPEAHAERQCHDPQLPCAPGRLGDSSSALLLGHHHQLELSPTSPATGQVPQHFHPHHKHHNFHHHLAQSPIPVKSVRSEGDHSWEKFVVVSAVGTVRSAEAEYGPNSFELTSADDPSERLVLRARNPDERDEWLLQFVRSFAAHLQDVVETAAVASSGGGVIALADGPRGPVHGRDRHRIALSPDRLAGAASSSTAMAAGAYTAISPRYTPSCVLSSSSHAGTPIPLSHGHGRHSLHRRRCQPSDQQQMVDRLALSYQDPSPLTRLHLMPQHARLDGDESPPSPSSESASSPPRLSYRSVTPTPFRGAPRRDLERTATPELSAPQSDYPETERPPPSRQCGRYVPPHQRAGAVTARAASPLLPTTTTTTTAPPSKEGAAVSSPPPARKYIPPHQRNRRGPAHPPGTAPLWTGVQMPSPAPALQPSSSVSHASVASAAASAVSPLFAPQETAPAVDWSSSEMHFVNVKLGGCADPELVVGSILDDFYIPRKNSRVCRSHPDPFGSAFAAPGNGGLRWEIGATSHIGVRDTNEDAYVIVGDLLEALKCHHGDSSASPETIWEPAPTSSSGAGAAATSSLFAIFDGHCGDHAARFAAERLLPVLHERSLLDRHDGAGRSEVDNWSLEDRLDRLQDAVRETVSALDEAFCNLCVEAGRQWESGTTALIVTLVEDRLVIANLGDARGVLCRSVSDEWDRESLENVGWNELPSAVDEDSGERFLWMEVTDVHSPHRDDERARIERANGWVTTEKEIPVGQLKRMVLIDQDVVDILKRGFCNDHTQPSPRASAPQRIIHISRVCGELAVSRAIGDRDFKAAFNVPRDGDGQPEEWDSPLFLPFPDDHSRSFVGDLVSNQPEFRSLRIGGEGVSEEFLLLACDGLWDVLDADDAVRLTRNMLFTKGWSAKQAANRLAELAVHLGSSDNITVIVLRFFHER